MTPDDASDRDTDTGSSTRFVPRSDDDEILWEVIEITAEKKNMYKVRWKGNDPMTGKPWPLQWVPRADCTDHLVVEWKKKKAKAEDKKGKKKRTSAATKKNREEESRAGSSRSNKARTMGKGKAKGSSLDSDSDVDEDAKRRHEDTEDELDIPPRGKHASSRKSTSSTITTYSRKPQKRASTSTKSTITAKRKRSSTSVTPQQRKLPNAHRFGSSMDQHVSSSQYPAKPNEPDSSGEDEVNPPPKKRQRVAAAEPEEEEESSDTDLPERVGPPRGVKTSASTVLFKTEVRLSTPAKPKSKKTPRPKSSESESEGQQARSKTSKFSKSSSKPSPKKRTTTSSKLTLVETDDEADDAAVESSLNIDNDNDLSAGGGYDLDLNRDDDFDLEMNLLDAGPPRVHADNDSPVERRDNALHRHTKMDRPSSPAIRISSSSPSFPENLTGAVRYNRTPSKNPESSTGGTSPPNPDPSHASKSPVSAAPSREQSPPPDISNISPHDRAILEIWERAVGYVYPETETASPGRDALTASPTTQKKKKKDRGLATDESSISEKQMVHSTPHKPAKAQNAAAAAAKRKAKEMKPIPRVSPGQFRKSVTMAHERASSAASASSPVHVDASSPPAQHHEVEYGDDEDEDFFSNLGRRPNTDVEDEAARPSYEDAIESFTPSPVKHSTKVYSRSPVDQSMHSPTFDDVYIAPSQPPTQVTIASSVPSPPPSPAPVKVRKGSNFGSRGDALTKLTDSEIREKGKAVFDEQRALVDATKKNERSADSWRPTSTNAKVRPRSPSVDPDENPFDSVSALPKAHDLEEHTLWERPDGIDEDREEPSKWVAPPGLDQECESPSKWVPVPGLNMDFIADASADSAVSLDFNPDPDDEDGDATVESSIPSASPARPRATQIMSAPQTMTATDADNSHTVSDSQPAGTQPDSSRPVLERLSNANPKRQLTNAEIEALRREEEEGTQDLLLEMGLCVDLPAIAPVRHEEEESTQDLLQEARAMGMDEPVAVATDVDTASAQGQPDPQTSGQSHSQSQEGPNGFTSIEVHPPSSARQSDLVEPLSSQLPAAPAQKAEPGNFRNASSGFGDVGADRTDAAAGASTGFLVNHTTLGPSSMLHAIPSANDDAKALKSTSLAEDVGSSDRWNEELARMATEIKGLREDRDREQRVYEEERRQWDAQREEWKRKERRWEEERAEWEAERTKAAATPPTPADEPLNESLSSSSISAPQPPVLSLADITAERDAAFATKALAEKDREFFREQYLQASNFVTSVRIENIELEKQAAAADARATQSDLRAKNGVEGIRALYELRIKTLQGELERERSMLRILQERDARTGGDAIRRQAAEAAELQVELANLREDYEGAVRGYDQLREVYDRVYEERMYLEKRAGKLKKQKEKLVVRLTELGALPVEGVEDGTTEEGGRGEGSEETGSSVLGLVEEMVVQKRDVSGEEDEDESADSDDKPDPEEPSCDYGNAEMEGAEEIEEVLYQCLWRPNNVEHCPRTFDTIEDLERHVRREHFAENIS